MTLPGVVARLRPTSNAPFLVCVSCPAAMSLSMLARPLSRFSPRVSSVRLSTCRVGQREIATAPSRRRSSWSRSAILCRASASSPSISSTEPSNWSDNCEIGLADGVEERVFAPFGRGEAAVPDRLGFAGRRHRGRPAEHLAPGFEPLGPGLRARRSSAPSGRVLRQLRRRTRTPGARIERRLSFACLLGPGFHHHLLGAAHDPASNAASPRASAMAGAGVRFGRSWERL